MMKPEWVCANNGKTYASKCWMQMSDCFSGTVYAVKKGKCDDHYGGRRGHHGGRHGRRHGHRHHSKCGMHYTSIPLAAETSEKKHLQSVNLPLASFVGDFSKSS